MPVPMDAKISAVASRIKTAAERHVNLTLQVEEEFTLASGYQLVSRRERRNRMVPPGGGREFYVEVAAQGPVEVVETSAAGAATVTGHTINVWLVYGYEEDTSTSTWRQIVESRNPQGVAVEFRQFCGYDTTPSGPILYQQPKWQYDVIPLGQSGGQQDYAHLMSGPIQVDDMQD